MWVSGDRGGQYLGGVPVNGRSRVRIIAGSSGSGDRASTEKESGLWSTENWMWVEETQYKMLHPLNTEKGGVRKSLSEIVWLWGVFRDKIP